MTHMHKQSTHHISTMPAAYRATSARSGGRKGRKATRKKSATGRKSLKRRQSNSKKRTRSARRYRGTEGEMIEKMIKEIKMTDVGSEGALRVKINNLETKINDELLDGVGPALATKCIKYKVVIDMFYGKFGGRRLILGMNCDPN